MNACCTGCSVEPLATPSMVVTCAPSAWAGSTRQLSLGTSSIRTVQAPHSPVSQPCLVPVSRRSSRSTSISVAYGLTSTSRSWPLTERRRTSRLPMALTSASLICVPLLRHSPPPGRWRSGETYYIIFDQRSEHVVNHFLSYRVKGPDRGQGNGVSAGTAIAWVSRALSGPQASVNRPAHRERLGTGPCPPAPCGRPADRRARSSHRSPLHPGPCARRRGLAVP